MDREVDHVRQWQANLPPGDRRKLASLSPGFCQVPLGQLWTLLPDEKRQRLGVVVARMVARAIMSREGGLSHDGRRC